MRRPHRRGNAARGQWRGHEAWRALAAPRPSR